MNAFQKQLMLGDKCMAELSGPERNGVGQPVPPAKVGVEEFESSLRPVETKQIECLKCGRIGRVTKFIPLRWSKCGECGSSQIRLYPSRRRK